MGFNMYKQIVNIKEELETDGFKRDIPKAVFCKKLMIMFGMKKQTSGAWFDNFETVDYITTNNIDNTINFNESEFK